MGAPKSLDEALDMGVMAGPGDAIVEDEMVSRVVISEELKDNPSKLKISLESRVRVRWNWEGEEEQEIEFIMLDGSVPYGLERALLGCTVSQTVEFLARGEAILTDHEPRTEDIDGRSRSGRAVILAVQNERKHKFAMLAHDKVAFGSEMNELGKVLFANGRLLFAAAKWQLAADAFSVFETEDEIVNPKGKANNRMCFQVSRRVYLNLALVMYKLGDFAECELFCSDVLDTFPDEPKDWPIKAKALFRRGCARLKLGKFSPDGSNFTSDMAEADFFIAKDLDESIDVERMFVAIAAARARGDVCVFSQSENIVQDDDITLTHYPTNLMGALQQIRRENLHDGLAFMPSEKRQRVLNERAEIYTRLMTETPWDDALGTMLAADSPNLPP